MKIFLGIGHYFFSKMMMLKFPLSAGRLQRLRKCRALRAGFDLTYWAEHAASEKIDSSGRFQ
jgi:hypothetical protein